MKVKGLRGDGGVRVIVRSGTKPSRQCMEAAMRTNKILGLNIS